MNIDPDLKYDLSGAISTCRFKSAFLIKEIEKIAKKNAI
jgi:hypothetical protein